MKGLSEEEVLKRKKIYGDNSLSKNKKDNFFKKVISVIFEPMFLLLLVAATIYFILGEPRDGLIMLIFIVGIISIDIIQEWKTDKTLEKLKNLSEPKITVIRDGTKKCINSIDLVPGDVMLIYEGIKIPADGKIIKCSGLKIDESTLTGEATGVWKSDKDNNSDDYFKSNCCYQGTLVVSGTGTIEVEKIGAFTEYGKIGENLSKIKESKTHLQKQTDLLVKNCALIAFVLFFLVSLFTFLNISDHSLADRLIESILSGVTLAMAMIPEEFPVILTVFLSMGAWRLAKRNSLVKKLTSVETLGAISVLCVDKTGTITKNEMEVKETYTNDLDKLCKIAGLCSEEHTYDNMEKAIFNYISEHGITKENLFEGEKVKEYPFSNDTKMMGVIWDFNSKLQLCVKGSPESVLDICNLTIEEQEIIYDKINSMQEKGLRAIAVANKKISNKEIEENLLEYDMEFVGILGFIDPPKDNIKEDILKFKQAGIRVVMITGDNGVTASSIASQIGMDNVKNVITGDMINKMSFEELKEQVKTVSIFSRVIPEHKMQIVKAFKENGEIVAMTGDGVNDAPALKYADIGIAMGGRGSEVSREAADLILLDDNFSTIVDTIKDGRRIYDNIKKAVGYIFVIHIPIALASLLAPLLGINPSDLFLLPLHIVLLELIIDPTCSIVLERQPAESNIMNRNPRKIDAKILDKKIFIKSLIQGITMFLGSFLTYYYILTNYNNSLLARSMGLLIIIISNMFLVQVISSEYDYAFISIKKMLKDSLLIIINLLTILGILIVYFPLNSILNLVALNITQILIVVLISFICTFWYEIVKVFKRLKK